MNKDQVLKLADFLEKAAEEAVDPTATDLDRVAEGVAALSGAKVAQRMDPGTAPRGAAPQQAQRTFKSQRSPVSTPLSASKSAPATTQVAPPPPPPGEKTAGIKEAQGVGVIQKLLGATGRLGTSVGQAAKSQKVLSHLSGAGHARGAVYEAAKDVRGRALKEVGKGLILPGAVAAGGYGAGKLVLGSVRQVGIGHVTAAAEAEEIEKEAARGKARARMIRGGRDILELLEKRPDLKQQIAKALKESKKAKKTKPPKASTPS